MIAFRVIRFLIVSIFFHWILYTVKIICSDEVKYIGCYFDDVNRMLDGIHFSKQMTLELCKQLCHSHRYLGLQNSQQCYCGNSLGDTNVYQKKIESECDMPCIGNLSQICGGRWRSSVYEIITPTLSTTILTKEGHLTMVPAEMTTNGQSVTTTELETLGESEDMIISGGSSVTSIQTSEPIAFKVTTTDISTLGQLDVTTTEITTLSQLDVTTKEITTLGQLDVTTTEITTFRQSDVDTTDMIIPGKSSVTTLQTAKPEASKVTTSEITMLGQLSVTTLQATELKTSEVTTIKTTPIFGISEVTSVQPISPLECLCPCSEIVKGKWDFVRGMNLTLDQLKDYMKPELDLMEKELSVNKSDTTRMLRSKISALDDRVSATSVGYVGVVFICLITVIIVFFDILGCFEGKFKTRS